MAVKTPADVKRFLWQTYDSFRQGDDDDSGEALKCILILFFIKSISDLWQETWAECEEKYQGSLKEIEGVMQRLRFALPKTARFDHLYAQRSTPNLGELLNTALIQIETTNQAQLGGVFQNIDFDSEEILGDTQERNQRLKHLLEDFNRLDLRPSQLEDEGVVGNCYEYLLQTWVTNSEKKEQGFYTPRSVSTLLAKIMSPRSGDIIADPCCGTGSLLIHTAQEVNDQEVDLYGQEMNEEIWALGRMNLFLYGFDSGKIEQGDTIRYPRFVEGDTLKQFNVLVANPPFSLDKWGQDWAKRDPFGRFGYGVPPKSRGDYAFILHIVSSMMETDGRAGVVVPHGVLFRGGTEGKIRQALIEDNLVDGVIGLPANLFLGTEIPVALIVFRRRKTDTNVFFIDASQGYEDVKYQNRLRNQDVEKIVKTWQQRRDIEKYAHLASFEGIKANDFNLSVPLYVDTLEEEDRNIKAVQAEIESLEAQLAQVRGQMDSYLDELGLLS
jgi:type I restriction enzyme M protein